jgi:hypothetical protein
MVQLNAVNVLGFELSVGAVTTRLTAIFKGEFPAEESVIATAPE